MERNAGERAREVELERVTRGLDRCIDAVTEGVPPSRVKDKMIDALNGDDLASSSAREALRALIERVVITPATDGITIDLIGDLAGIVHVASGGTTRGTAVFGEPSDQHIAGHRTHLYRTDVPGLFRTSA